MEKIIVKRQNLIKFLILGIIVWTIGSLTNIIPVASLGFLGAVISCLWLYLTNPKGEMEEKKNPDSEPGMFSLLIGLIFLLICVFAILYLIKFGLQLIS